MKNLQNALTLAESAAHLMDDSDTFTIDGSAYHCTVERHMSRLGGMCAVVYSFAVYISRNNDGRFFCSAVQLGEYFGCDEGTVRRALKKLTANGWLELKSRGKFTSNNYRVVSHIEWGQKNPGHCPERIEIDFFDKDDPLARALWAISGGRVKWQRFQIANLRNTCISDGQIKEHFEKFWTESGQSIGSRYVSARFYSWLQAKRRTQ